MSSFLRPERARRKLSGQWVDFLQGGRSDITTSCTAGAGSGYGLRQDITRAQYCDEHPKYCLP
jgi:hypothetical protein